MISYFLYRLVFPNGKIYTGITNNVEKRFREHKRAARNGSPLPVHRAICKYGEINVRCSTLAEGPRDYIAELEIAAIAQTKGYNVSTGGDISPMLEASTRAKVAASMRERFKDPAIRQANREAQRIAQNRPEVAAKRKATRGTVLHSAETRAKMSAVRKGRKQSPKHVENNSIARLGAKRSEESRARMSIGQKKRVRTPEENERLRVLAKGRIVTPEHRERLRLAALARWERTRNILPD